MEIQFIVERAWLMTGIYFALGVIFAMPFLLRGVEQIDPDASDGSRVFRLLILPGVIWFWPFLLKRWIQTSGQPPEESNAHRSASKRANMDQFRKLEEELAEGREVS